MSTLATGLLIYAIALLTLIALIGLTVLIIAAIDAGRHHFRH